MRRDIVYEVKYRINDIIYRGIRVEFCCGLYWNEMSDKLAKQGAMKNMSATSCNTILSYHEIYAILKNSMYKDIDKNKPSILSGPIYSARLIYKFRLNSSNTKYSQKVTCISTNPISVYHVLPECPIITALFKKDRYVFTSCNNVIHILYNTDVISYIATLIVHSPVGKLLKL